MTTCERCGTEVENRKGTRFCSRACRQHVYRETHPEQVAKSREIFNRRRREGYVPKNTARKRVHAGIDINRTGTPGEPDCVVSVQLVPGAELQLSQSEAKRLGDRLRHIGYAAAGHHDTPEYQVLERIYTESHHEADIVHLWIEGTPVDILIKHRESALIGNQLSYHGGLGTEPSFRHGAVPEEPDEILVEELLTNRHRPYDGKIPYGQKPVYIRELRNEGWSVTEIMLRLRASGRTVKEALT